MAHPRLSREIADRLRAVLSSGEWHDLSKIRSGVGARGVHLQSLLGLGDVNDTLSAPDIRNWELKCKGDAAPGRRVSLVAVAPMPKGILRKVFETFTVLEDGTRLDSMCGDPVKNGEWAGRMWWEHGEDVLYLRHDSERSDFPPLSWSHDALMRAFAGKVRNLILVSGKVNGKFFRYEKATLFYGLKASRIIDLLFEDVVKTEFQLRRVKGKIKNGGFRWRIVVEDLHRLFEHQEPFV